MEKAYIEGIEPLQKYFFNSCFYSSLFPVVEYYGRSVIPFMVNGMGAYMFYNTKERCSAYIRFYQEKPVSDILEDIGLDCIQYDICEDVFPVIIKHINEGKPVIIVADCYYEFIRPEMYMQNHLPHYLLLYGYDMENKEFYIIEQNHIDDIRYDKKVISLTELENAYRGFLDLYYKENRGTIWAIYSQDENYFFDKEKYRNINIQNLNINAEKLYAGQIELEAFYERFSMILYDNKIFFRYAEDIIEGINDIVKYFNAKRLQYSSLYEDESPCRKLFEQIYDRWSTLRTIIAKGYFAGDLKQSKKDKLIRNLEAIIKENKEFIDIIINQKEEGHDC